MRIKLKSNQPRPLFEKQMGLDKIKQFYLTLKVVCSLQSIV